MFADLSPGDRMLLLQFACAFAWADLVVTDGERRFVSRLVEKLDLSPEERAQVDRWLEVSPSPHAIDPARVPREHRRLFIEAVRATVYSDGVVDPEERVLFDRFRASLQD